MGGSILGRALTKAGGRLSVPKPGWLESPEQAVEGDVGIWYLEELFCLEIRGRVQRCVTSDSSMSLPEGIRIIAAVYMIKALGWDQKL